MAKAKKAEVRIELESAGEGVAGRLEGAPHKGSGKQKAKEGTGIEPFDDSVIRHQSPGVAAGNTATCSLLGAEVRCICWIDGFAGLDRCSGRSGDLYRSTG